MHALVSICFLFFLNFFNLQADELYPRIRLGNNFELPPNFRVMNSDYIKNPSCKVTREGLDQIRVSGSGQFSENSLKHLMTVVPSENLIVLDLRRECHGSVNGCAVSWKITGAADYTYVYNLGLSFEEIEAKEYKMIQDLLVNNVDEYNDGSKTITFKTESVLSERELVEKLGANYIRIPVIDHHYPSDEEADNIVYLVKSMPAGSWLHLHCAAGEGRTTTVMSMIDMMYNSSFLSPLEIMQRQRAIGGAIVYDPEGHYADRPHRLAQAVERRDFLNLFHQYCVENPHFEETWSSWKARQSQKKPELVICNFVPTEAEK